MIISINKNYPNPYFHSNHLQISPKKYFNVSLIALFALNPSIKTKLIEISIYQKILSSKRVSQPKVYRQANLNLCLCNKKIRSSLIWSKLEMSKFKTNIKFNGNDYQLRQIKRMSYLIVSSHSTYVKKTLFSQITSLFFNP